MVERRSRKYTARHVAFSREELHVGEKRVGDREGDNVTDLDAQQ